MTGAKRILVIFGNNLLFGQELGNMQVLSSLKSWGIESLFITDRERGRLRIQAALQQRNLNWTTATFPRVFARSMGIRSWLRQLRDLLRCSWRFFWIYREYAPTHVHIGNERFFISTLPALLLLRCPVVFRLGDTPRQHRWIFRFLWRHIIVRRVDYFVCISEFIRTRLLDAGANDGKIRVIYNYPPERPVDNPNTETLPEEFRGVTVLYVGQLTKEKGVHLLVDAAVALCGERPDVRFLVAGDYGPKNSFADDLMVKVAELGLSTRIQFLGYIFNIPQLFAYSTIHACPSVRDESLGNVIVEAKQAGKPSVIFPSGGLPELITDRKDGYICQRKTANALKEGLTFFIRDQSVTEMAGRNARASLDHLGITKSIFERQWRSIYQNGVRTR